MITTVISLTASSFTVVMTSQANSGSIALIQRQKAPLTWMSRRPVANPRS
ncbi:MAG: hypothetical protein H0W72_09065 [Planctomycetes bacterium]|nr:hypothetical protein [Planctomycetota bacterium]